MASPADVCKLCMRWNYDQTQLNTGCLSVLVTHTLGYIQHNVLTDTIVDASQDKVGSTSLKLSSYNGWVLVLLNSHFYFDMNDIM